MILNHIWGLYAHPKEEWHVIEKRHESLSYSLMHILTIALIPAICCYYATAYIGWTISVGNPIKITHPDVLLKYIKDKDFTFSAEDIGIKFFNNKRGQ